jgi:hypothetical protein
MTGARKKWLDDLVYTYREDGYEIIRSVVSQITRGTKLTEIKLREGVSQRKQSLMEKLEDLET